MKKRIIPLALALLMVVALIPSALAAGSTVTQVFDIRGGRNVTLEFTNVTSQVVKDYSMATAPDIAFAKNTTVIYCDAPTTITLRPNNGEEHAAVIALPYLYNVAEDSIKWDLKYYEALYTYDNNGNISSWEYYTTEKSDTPYITMSIGNQTFAYALADGSSITFTQPGEYPLDIIVDGSKSEGYPICIVVGSNAHTEPSPEPAPTPAPAPSPTATPNAAKVILDGKETAFDAYTINQENYFKLRDVAYVFNSTRVQFDVALVNSVITLTSKVAYKPDGSEMKSKGTVIKTPVLNKSKIILDGKEVELTAYTIDGNNYFKLRELAQAFDFYVGYDGTITIDTSKTYAA